MSDATTGIATSNQTFSPAEAQALAEMKSLVASLLVGRRNFGRAAGYTFEGKRNVSEVLGYAEKISPEDYRLRFERGELAGRIVTAYPDATWQGGVELVEDEDPEVVTGFEEDWFTLSDRLKVVSRLHRADILAGLGRHAVVLIGVAGDSDLSHPLPKVTASATSQKGVLFLSAYSEEDAAINPDHIVEATNSDRFGFPEFYEVKRLVPRTPSQVTKVHWTRLVHIAEGLLDDDLSGTPRLQRVWNRLDDVDKVAGSGSEAYWQRVHQGMQLDMDKDVALSLEANPKLKQELAEQVENYAHGLTRIFKTAGVKLKMLGSDVETFDVNVETLLMLIAAGTGIPKRILSGSEQGELASSQDENNFNKRVANRRAQHADPNILRPLADRLIEYGYVRRPEQYMARWPEPEDASDDTKAGIALKMAQTNQANKKTVYTENEIRDRVWAWPPLEEDAAGEEEVGEPTPDDVDAEDEADAAAAAEEEAEALPVAARRLRAAKLAILAAKPARRRALAKKKSRRRPWRQTPAIVLLHRRPAGTSEGSGS